MTAQTPAAPVGGPGNGSPPLRSAPGPRGRNFGGPDGSTCRGVRIPLRPATVARTASAARVGPRPGCARTQFPGMPGTAATPRCPWSAAGRTHDMRAGRGRRPSLRGQGEPQATVTQPMAGAGRRAGRSSCSASSGTTARGWPTSAPAHDEAMALRAARPYRSRQRGAQDGRGARLGLDASRGVSRRSPRRARPGGIRPPCRALSVESPSDVGGRRISRRPQAPAPRAGSGRLPKRGIRRPPLP